MNNPTYVLSRVCITFVCCGMLVWSACSAPDAPQPDNTPPIDTAQQRRDNLNALMIGSILDTAHIPSDLVSAARYLTTIIPTIKDHDFLFMYAMFSENDRDSIIYLPFYTAPNHVPTTIQNALVIRKNKSADKVTSFYLSEKVERWDEQFVDSAFIETRYKDLALRTISTTLRMVKGNRSRFQFIIYRGAIFDTYHEKAKQDEVVRLLTPIISVSVFDRYAPLEGLQNQLENIGGETSKLFKIVSVPVDIDHNGMIDDAELLQSISLREGGGATLWCNGCLPNTDLPNVTVVAYIRTKYIPLRGGALNGSYGSAGGLPEEYWQRAGQGKPEPPKGKVYADCEKMMFKEIKLQSPGNSGNAGAVRGCARIDGQTGKPKYHPGIDIATPLYTPITTVPIKDPFVVGLEYKHKDLGNYVILEGFDYRNPEEKIFIVLAHLSQIYVKQLPNGQYDYRQGDLLGLSGATGNADSNRPHVHIQVGMSAEDAVTGLRSRFQSANLLPKDDEKAIGIYKGMTCDEKQKMLGEYSKKKGKPEDFYEPLTHLPYEFDLKTGKCTNCKTDCK